MRTSEALALVGSLGSDRITSFARGRARASRFGRHLGGFSAPAKRKLPFCGGFEAPLPGFEPGFPD